MRMINLSNMLQIKSNKKSFYLTSLFVTKNF
jgi:hypothetical protein